MPYRDCEAGLTIHLPFDPTSGVTEELLCFLEWPLRYFFDRYVWSGIPCFALRLGNDVATAERVIMLLLIDVYGYTTGTEFECELSDLGAIDDEAEESDDEDEGSVGDGREDGPEFGESKNGEVADEEKDHLDNHGDGSSGKACPNERRKGSTPPPPGEG
jgi:hypothetical protein